MGAFTQLIHAPVDYDHREFLVSIFQRICEAVIALIDIKFGQPDSLKKRGRVELRRLLGVGLVLVVGLVVSSAGPIVYFNYRSDAEWFEMREADRRETLNLLNNELRSISDTITMLAERESFTGGSVDGSVIETRLTQLASQQSRIIQEINRFQNSETFDPSWWPILLTAVGVIGYAAVVFLLRFLVRTLRKAYCAMRFPRETGLRALAVELAERLKFETTRSSTAEGGLSYLRLRVARSLKERPLSLPGITAQFARLLKHIAEVYGDRVVICLDELDKIQDPAKLEALLRGIKGVLGEEATHFILTISDDAASRFTTRVRAERGMVESALEDVILLRRVDLRATERIIGTMCGIMSQPMAGKDSDSHGRKVLAPASVVLWVFGGAIPREIKRGALMCLERGVDPRKASATEIWTLLLRLRFESILAWATREGSDDPPTLRFCRSLRESSRFLPQVGDCGESVSRRGNKMVEIWQIWFIDNITDVAPGIESAVNEDSAPEAGLDAVWCRFARAAIEIVLGASALAFTFELQRHQPDDTAIEKVRLIFEMIPCNVAYTWQLVSEHLKEIHCGE